MRSSTHLDFRMTQIVRLVIKEWRLLARNPHGLAVLFLMPAIFVLVMSFSLKNTLVAAVDMPSVGWVLEDNSPPVKQWLKNWQLRHGGQLFESSAELVRALKAGSVATGVIVHKPLLSDEGRALGENIEIWLNNHVAPAAAAKLRVELGFSLLELNLQIAAAKAGPFASVLLGDGSSSEVMSNQHAPLVRYVYEIESGRRMTAVQQSVPAWLVFGMFFVVIPIAGVLIQERNDGTLVRLMTLGVTPSIVLTGKLIAFLLLNWGQLIFMLLVGRWLVPALGGDALYLNIAYGWFFLVVFATSAAAVGLALLIAAYTRSFDQAAALGGGLNVVLAAIAGIMVPRMLMPPALQTLSEWSPMGWALDAMKSVFLGEPDAALVLPRVALLLAFSLVCMALSWWSIRRYGSKKY